MAKRTPQTDTKARNRIADFGQRLRAARLRRNMTQASLADSVGVAIPTLRKLEEGDPSTSMATMLLVLDVLGLGSDIDLLAALDREGQAMQDQKLTRPTTGSRRRMNWGA